MIQAERSRPAATFSAHRQGIFDNVGKDGCKRGIVEGHRYPVESHSEGFSRLPKIDVQLDERFGLLLHEADGYDHDLISFEVPQYFSGFGLRPLHAGPIRVILISYSRVFNAELSRKRCAVILYVQVVPAAFFQIANRRPVRRKDKTRTGIG